MKYVGWQFVIGFTVLCLLTGCSRNCLVPDTNRGEECNFIATIGIPI